MIRMLTGLIIFLFGVSCIYSQQFWLTQPSQTAKNLRSCVFTDTSKGWIAGDSGLIINTTNKGQTWNTQNSGTNNEIVSMHFINQRYAFALSWEVNDTPPNHYGTRILRTTNGGNNWSNYLFPDTSLFLNTIYFIDSLNGYMGGSEGIILYTTNSGTDWLEVTIDSSAFTGFPVEKIKFYNSQLGFAVGGAFDIAGMVWKTTNGGRNWRTLIVGPEPINDIHIYDSLNSIGIGGDYEYGSSNIQTSNAGSTWNYTEFGIFGIANTIAYRTEMEAWISLGIVDSFLMTIDNGASWKLVGTPNGAKIHDMIFINERNGWAVGNAGVILMYNSNLVNVAGDMSIPQTNKLHEIYPNPFNPSTNILYSLAHNSHVQIKLYDISGKEIETIEKGFQTAGDYNFRFHPNNLSSGIYFVKLLTRENSLMKDFEYSKTKKIVYIK